MNYCYCKCLKCKKVFNMDNTSALEAGELGKKGCSSCQSKNLEWKVCLEGIELSWTTDKCPQCYLPKVMDILNWEEVKAMFIKKRGIKTKQEAIKEINNKGDNNCYCGNLEDKDQEREENCQVEVQDTQIRGYN